MKLSKCYKRLMGLKETTETKDNLEKLEQVYRISGISVRPGRCTGTRIRLG